MGQVLATKVNLWNFGVFIQQGTTYTWLFVHHISRFGLTYEKTKLLIISKTVEKSLLNKIYQG